MRIYLILYGCRNVLFIRDLLSTDTITSIWMRKKNIQFFQSDSEKVLFDTANFKHETSNIRKACIGTRYMLWHVLNTFALPQLR